MIKLLDLLKEYNKSQLDYIASKLNTQRDDEFNNLMNALDAQGLKYPSLKAKIEKGEIKSLDDLKILKKQSKSDIAKLSKSNSEVVFENDRFLIVVPYTEEASCYYGKGTKWCTTSKNSYYNQFQEYTYYYGYTLYYIIDKSKGIRNNYYKVALQITKNGKIFLGYLADDEEIDEKELKDYLKYLKENGVNLSIFKPKYKEIRKINKDRYG